MYEKHHQHHPFHPHICRGFRSGSRHLPIGAIRAQCSNHQILRGLHQAQDYPYVGYGHRIQPGELYRSPLSRKQADRLLRRDLRKLCKMFEGYGEYTLLLATLAYNVGYGTLMGNAERPKSQLVQKIERGEKDIYQDYISFCRYNGKVVPSIRRRRMVEYHVLMEN